MKSVWNGAGTFGHSKNTYREIYRVPFNIHVRLDFTVILLTFFVGMIKINDCFVWQESVCPVCAQFYIGYDKILPISVNGSFRKSGVSFWQCCFPIRSSRLTRYPSVPIYAIIWCISVKNLVGTGYAFLIGFRIVKGGYISIDRNKAVVQGCRLYVHFTQHVSIFYLFLQIIF